MRKKLATYELFINLLVRMLLELINTDKSAFSGSVATSTTGGARTNEPDQSTSSVCLYYL